MKHRNSKFLLIGLLILSILISISAINAVTEDTNGTSAMKTVDDTQDMINTQTDTLQKKEDSIKSTVKTENKNNTKNEKTIKNEKKAENKKNTTTDKTVKKAYTVNSYDSLYNTIETIKKTGTSSEETINLSPGNWNIDKTIRWGNITQTTKTLTINGNGIRIYGYQYFYGTKHQFLDVRRGYTLNLQNINIQGCEATEGGVIKNNGNITIRKSTFSNNQGRWGGVIHNNGTMNIINSTFNNNNATDWGGVIHNLKNITITNSTFRNNNGKLGAGVNNNDHGNMNITNSTFSDNNGNTRGGANVNYYGNLTITNSNFTNNSAENGGVNQNDHGNITIINSMFSHNHGTYGGVNSNQWNSNLNINDSIFYNNTGTWGAVNYNNNTSKLNITSSNFTNNTAYLDGGVNFNNEACTMNINNSNFKYNKGEYGGVNNNKGSINIYNSQFDHNSASYNGGVNLNDFNGKIYINGSNFTYNNATEKGGVNYNDVGQVNIYNSNLNYNKATNGSVNYQVNGNIELSNSKFNNNIATEKGGVNYIENGHITMTYSSFNNNRAVTAGVNYNNATMNIRYSNFTQNRGTDSGVSENYGNTSITYSNFISNSVTHDGGVNNNFANMNISRSNFTSNSAGHDSGIAANMGNLSITYSNFNSNTATSGAVINQWDINNVISNLTISDSNFTKNKATKDGIINNYHIDINPKVNITNSNFINNTASGIGIIYNTASLNIRNSSFFNNFDNRNITIYSTKTFTLTSSRIINNMTQVIGSNTVRAPIANSALSSSEYVAFKVGSDSVVGSRNSDGYIAVSKTFSYGLYPVTITYPSYNNGNNITINYLLKRSINTNSITSQTTAVDSSLYINQTIKDTTGKTLNERILANATINGKTETVTIENNGYLNTYLTITENLAVGNYTLKIDIPESNGYYKATLTTTVSITRRTISDPTITTIIEVFENLTINTQLTDTNNTQLKGEVLGSIKLDDKTTPVNIINGRLNSTIQADNLAVGSYTLTITIPESAKYNTATFIRTLNITRRTIDTINIPATVNPYQNMTINTQIKDTNNQTIKDETSITITLTGGETKTLKITNGELQTTLKTDTLTPGNYTVTINMPETANYNAATINTVLSIGKRQILIPTIADAIEVFRNLTINTTVTDTNHETITGEITATITINGDTKTVTITNGKLETTLKTDSLTPEDYTITINMPETEIYTISQFTKTLTIQKRTINTIDMPTIIDVFENTTIKTTLKDTNNEAIKDTMQATITVEGKQTTVTIENGELGVIIPTDNINPGVHEVIINIPTTTNYKTVTFTKNLTINKREIQTPTITDTTIQVMENLTVVTIIKDTKEDRTKGEIPVTITIDNETYNATIKDGLLYTTIPTAKLPGGEYTATMNIPESINYNNQEKTVKLTINKRTIQNTTLPDNHIKTMLDTQLITIVNDTIGNPLQGENHATITVNGEIIPTEIINGLLYVPLKTGEYQAGEYIVNIEIPETEKYTQGKITQKLTIEKREIQNTTLPDEEVEIATNKTIKTTLKDNDGNNIVGEIQATAKIKDDITIITIKDGIIETTLKTDTLPPGEYNIEIEIPESTNYKEAKVTQKIIIVPKKAIENKTLDDLENVVYNETLINITVEDVNKEALVGEITAILTVGDITKTVTIKEGKIETTIPTQTLKPGEYTIKITIPESMKYLEGEITQKLTIQKRTIDTTQRPTITIREETNTTIETTIKDTQNEAVKDEINATIKLGETNTTVTIVNSEINITLPTETLTPGEYNITIEIPETENYKTATINIPLTIEERKNINTTIPDITINVFENTTIQDVIVDTEDEPLKGELDATITIINNKEIPVKIVNGVIDTILPTETLTPGTYTIKIEIPQSIDYNAATINVQLTINKRELNQSQTLPNHAVVEKTDGKIVVIVNDTLGEQLRGEVDANITFNNQNIPIKIINGLINTTIPTRTLERGSQNVLIISIAESENYTAGSINQVITIVEKFNINTTGMPDKEIEILENTTIKTVLNDTKGQPLRGTLEATISIVGQTQIPSVSVTITNGVIDCLVPTDTLTPGEYTILIFIPISDDYNQAMIQQKVTVIKRIINNTTLPDHDVPALKDTTLNITLKDTKDVPLKGSIDATITLNGEEIPVKIVDGEINVDLSTSTLTQGIYEMTINIPESDYYNATTIKQNLVVRDKQDIKQTSLPDIEVVEETNATINVELTDKEDKPLKDAINATITINGKDVPVTIVNGVIDTVIPTDDLTPGEYTATINIPESDYYNAATITQKIIIKERKNINTIIPDITINVFENTTINTTLKDTESEILKGEINVTITIGNTTIPATIKDGVIETIIPTEVLEPGEYNVVIEIPQSTNYNAATINVQLTINKRGINNTTVPELRTDEFKNTTLNTVLKDTQDEVLKGEISGTITIGNITEVVTIKDGIINTQIPTETLNPGVYNVVIEIPATMNYNATTINTNLTISKRSINNQTVSDITINVLENATINTELKDTQNETLKGEIEATIKVGNKIYITKIINGVINTQIPTETLAPGVYDVVINIPETVNYNAVTINTQLAINKRSINETNIPETSIDVFKNTTITTTIKDTQDEVLKGEINATIKVGNITIPVTIKDGEIDALVPTETLTPGVYDIIVEIPESTNYNSMIINTKLTINKINVDITPIADLEVDVLENIRLNTTIKDAQGETLKGTIEATITINGEEIPVTIKDGVIDIIIPSKTLDAGEYNITVNIPESTNYNTATINTKLTISKKTVENINLTGAEITVNKNHTITILIKDTNNETLKGNIKVSVKINGKTYKQTTIVDGLLNVEVPTEALKPGIHNITIKLGESNYYTACEVTQAVKINARTAKVTTTTSKATTNSHITFDVIVEDSENQVVNTGFVIFKINGKTILDENGKAIRAYVKNNHATLTYKLPITIGAGKYKLNTIYDGQNMHGQVRLTTNFTLTKMGIDNVTVENITQLTQVNTPINIVLKDAERKQLEGNSSISVKINGKTYMKTTIKDGILKLSLPTKDLRGAKTYQVTIIVGENRIYTQQNIQFNITINNRDAIIKTKQTTPTITNNTLKLNTEVLTSYGVVNDGYITYKIDGKTITQNGQAVKVNITNGHANFTYKLDGKYKTGEHNITTTYYNPYYNQVTDTIKIKA